MIPPGGGGRTMGFESVRVTVLSVATDGTCLVRDTLGKDRTVRYDMRPKGSGIPAVDELWMLHRRGEVWVLGAMVNAPLPVVTGVRSTSDDLAVSLLDALVALGLVQDDTTA